MRTSERIRKIARTFEAAITSTDDALARINDLEKRKIHMTSVLQLAEDAHRRLTEAMDQADEAARQLERH